MISQSVQSPAEAREWLDRHGVTVTDWARAKGFDPAVVFALLSGRTRGRRGMAYQAAVALGIRAAPGDWERHPLEDDVRRHPGDEGGNGEPSQKPGGAPMT